MKCAGYALSFQRSQGDLMCWRGPIHPRLGDLNSASTGDPPTHPYRNILCTMGWGLNLDCCSPISGTALGMYWVWQIQQHRIGIRVMVGGHSKIGFWPTFPPTGICKQAMHDGMGPEFRLLHTKLRDCPGHELGMADPAVEDLNQSYDGGAL